MVGLKFCEACDKYVLGIYGVLVGYNWVNKGI